MADETQSKTKMSRGARILLVASLALNLAVMGVVAGVVLGGGPKDRFQRFELGAGPLTRAMDDTRRGAVRDALRDSGAFRPADRDSMRRDTQALVTTLRAEDFDSAAFQDILTRQQNRLRDGQAAVVAAVTEQVSEMDAAERAAFADRLENQLRRGPRTNRDR